MVAHLRHVWEVVGPDVFIPGPPHLHDCEAVKDLQVVELQGQALQVGIDRSESTWHELAPALSADSKGGGQAPEDEQAAEVIYDEAMPPPAQEDANRADEEHTYYLY